MSIKPQDLINQLESIISDLNENGYSRQPVDEFRDTFLGLVDELYCEHWCDDTEDCCYENQCNDCEYNDTYENADVTEEEDEEDREE